MNSHRYTGAASLVVLHEEHLRTFLTTWRQAKAADVQLPETDDASYNSLEDLLRHVLRAARGYMVWACEKMELADPQIDPTPQTNRIESDAGVYIEHLLGRWQLPLADVEQEQFDVVYKSRWGIGYCVDAMLEHAVMHPIRHTAQLRKLM